MTRETDETADRRQRARRALLAAGADWVTLKRAGHAASLSGGGSSGERKAEARSPPFSPMAVRNGDAPEEDAPSARATSIR